MGRKTKYSKEIKLEIIKRYLNGESALVLRDLYHLPKYGDTKIMHWVTRYRVLGNRMFESSNRNKSYSKEFKLKIIKAYLNGEGSYEDLANNYNISSDVIVMDWVLKYNQGIEIKDYNPKSEVYTMKSRKTTFEERLDIVKYVLANNNDYKGGCRQIFSAICKHISMGFKV